MPQKRGNAFDLAMDSFPFYRGHNLFLTLCMTERRELSQGHTGGLGQRSVTTGLQQAEAMTEDCKGKDREEEREQKNTCKSEGIMKGRKPYMVRGVDLVEGDQEACEKK